MSRIANFSDGPMPKPDKTGPKPKKYLKIKPDTAWAKTRRTFLKLQRRTHRGGYICDMCSRETDNPEVDHVATRGSRPDLKHNLKNLRVLCHSCHQIRHKQI